MERNSRLNPASRKFVLILNSPPTAGLIFPSVFQSRQQIPASAQLNLPAKLIKDFGSALMDRCAPGQRESGAQRLLPGTTRLRSTAEENIPVNAAHEY